MQALPKQIEKAVKRCAGLTRQHRRNLARKLGFDWKVYRKVESNLGVAPTK